MKPTMTSANSKRIAPKLLVLLLVGGLMVFQTVVAVCQDRNADAAKKATAKSHERVPTDDAPQELKRLIRDGKVEVVYDSDPDFVNAARAWADFHIQLRYTFKYDLVKKRKGGRWQVKLTVTELESKIDLTHLIRLPVTFKSPDVWRLRTMRHEFDHVAISLDPRVMMLLKHLLDHLPEIERTLEAKESPTNDVLNKLIDDEVVRRREAVVELMRQNNRRLDKVGAHGAQVVPDRAAFFAKLYTKENLAEMQFPFIEQVLDLLETPAYQQAELPFLTRDPAAR